MVFVNSMADLFHAKVTLPFIREVFEVMRATPQHTYQILTKRSLRLLRFADKLDWPSNVRMGVPVEAHRRCSALTISGKYLPLFDSSRVSHFSGRWKA